MLPSPQGTAESKDESREPDGAKDTQLQQPSEQDSSKEASSQDPISLSAQSKALPSPENKKLKMRKEKKMLKEKKKKKSNSTFDEPVEARGIDIQSAIEEMERVQKQNMQVDPNNKITRPVLNVDQEIVLGNNFINVLEQVSPKHPTAMFHCVICKKFCKSYGMVLGHINEPLHRQKLQRVMDDMTLECLPPPTIEQVDSVGRLVHGVQSTYGLGERTMKDRQHITEQLNTLAQELHPDCGVRMYGSTITGLALRKSDLNLELTVGDESMASKMLCQMADELEKDELYRDVERNFTDSEPALKFFVKDCCFRCVLIMQNKHSYKLSELIADYVAIDPRVKQLGLMFRTMAADLSLDKPDMGFWPAHAFALLMIYFLQQLKDPVLPVLHELVDSLEYNPEVYCDAKELAEKWHTTNTMSVGELWLKFLRFYTVEFPIHDYVVCIRQKAPLTRASKNWTGKKIAIEDPFLPKVNVSRSLEIFTCFEFAMNCLRKAYKYFGVLQLPTDPILSWIYDSSRYNCTFQPLTVNRKSLERLTEFHPYFSDKPVENVKCTWPERVVRKEDVGFLFGILNPKYLSYKYDASKFVGKEGLPVRCAACGNMGHSASRCKMEKLLPIPDNLPPMEDYYLDAILKCCTEIEEKWKMQPDEVEKRRQIVSDLEKFVCLKKPDATLELFGSSCNGFGLQKSDLDICMTFKNNEKGEGIEFVKAIEELTFMLKSYGKMKNILAITTAKVPIMKFYLPESDLEGDISMYNVLALRNTQLLNTYAGIDPRVKTLGCVVKRFAKVCDICDASRGSLSSYAYILMLIFFLQRSNPPVLPVLQELCKPQESQFMVEEFDTYFYYDLSQLPSVWEHYGKNKASVSDLWLGFLEFYSKFDFNLNVISIRQLKPVLRFDKRWTNKVMAIEDPFELTHNLGARLSRKMLVYIINTFRTAYRLFGTPRTSCLDYVGQLERYFLDPRQLTSGEPPNDRGCRLCKKTDHMIKQCPLRKQNRAKNVQQKRGNGPVMERRQAPRNEAAQARKMVPQQGKHPPLLQPGFSPHQSGMPFPRSYRQLLYMNTDLTRNAQNLRYNKIPPAFSGRSGNNGQQQVNLKQGAPPLLSSPKFNNSNRPAAAAAGGSAQSVGFGADRVLDLSERLRHINGNNTAVLDLSERLRHINCNNTAVLDLSERLRQVNVNNTAASFRFQLNNGVNMPGPSSVSQNAVYKFSAKNNSQGPSPRFFNGTVPPFERPPLRPSTFCYGPPKTPPVIDVGVNYNQTK